MKKTVYIETTIPSSYYDIRADPEAVARRQWTRTFWDFESTDYEIVTGVGVIDELQRGSYPYQAEKLALLSGLQILPISNEIVEIVEVYINHKVMPAEPTGDALHLATAAYYKMDILLTWNCKHIANIKKLDHIQRVNANLGLTTPLLITPLNLTGEDYDRH